MAAQSLLFLLLLAAITSFASSAGSDCSSNTTASLKRDYAACFRLPRLNSSLYWSYDSAAGNLSFAFVAAPPRSGGWVAWAINPTATGMVGSQALIAFRQPSGKMAVKTYNITGYGPIEEGPIAFETSDLAAEFAAADGAIRMYGSVKLPKGTTTVNQVWQVGAKVAHGVPRKHHMKLENMDSMGVVDLSKGSTDVAAAPTPSTTAVIKKSAGGSKNVNALLSSVLAVSAFVVSL